MNKQIFSLGEVLRHLRDIILADHMWDNGNSYIILCSSELESVIHQKAFHISELQGLITPHLIENSDADASSSNNGARP